MHRAGTDHHIGLSVGVAVGDCPPGSLHALSREADASRYGVKRSGRGRVAWAPGTASTVDPAGVTLRPDTSVGSLAGPDAASDGTLTTADLLPALLA